MINSYSLPDVKFKEHFLINSNISAFRKVIDLYSSCRVDTWSRALNTDFTFGISFYGAVGLTKNADPDKYG